PDRVKRLALIAAPVYTAEELARQRQTMGHPEPLEEDGAHVLRRWRSLYDWRGPGQTLAMIQQEFAESLRGGSVAWYGHHAAFAYSHADHLPRATQPIMILCPDDDLLTPTLRAEALLNPDNGSRFVRLPGWGHGMLTLHTDAIAALLRSFFDQAP
ncbi:MAG: hypothetical protein NZ518_00950, partial [Dehalococcoidia bacterium]|nr:hypothetical protein [Dehalococcoidia bacterium]